MGIKYGDKLQNQIGMWFYNKGNDRNKRVHHSFRFRIDPVPFIRKNVTSTGFKHPKTTQERKYSFCDQCKEYNVKIRQRRNCINLPNDWDDIVKGNNQKGWKSQTKKRKQWEK